MADARDDDDAPLVERAQGGDREALGDLFVRHAHTVRRLLAGVLGSSNDLDDLVQDVFIQVFRSLPSFRRESRFTTWLHQVTLYAAYNHMRRPRRVVLAERPEDAAPEPVGEPGPFAELHGREALARLDAILAAIKPKKRIAFILFAVEGYSVNEISEMVKAPIPTVKSRIWFARRELRRRAQRDPYLSGILAEMETEDDEER
jgi:RNA polymerase sigma-70 factor, ECF subfamily